MAPARETELTELTRDYATLQEIYRGPAGRRTRNRRSPRTSNGGRSASSSSCSIRRGCRSGRSARTASLINLVGRRFGLVLGLALVGVPRVSRHVSFKTDEDVMRRARRCRCWRGFR